MLRKIKAIQSSRLFHAQSYRLSVRVRYAPSPTGNMHIGGLRTALFNQLFAQKLSGKFILRIQDTDQSRQVPGSLLNIFDTLRWIGITPDESINHEGEYGPYKQSERLPLYRSIEQSLLKNNMAYPCFCSQADSSTFVYSGKCRNLSLQQIKHRISNKESYSIRIKNDLVEWPRTFKDEIFGEIPFKTIDDFIIVRSNKWPTFHFANVIDDWKMKITHVMRGQEWLTNTNKHVYLYKVLKAPEPRWVHLPLVKSLSGKKLAKRDPQSSINALMDGKYQVQAVKSFIFGLGMGTTEKEEPETKEQQNSSEQDQKKGALKSKKQKKVEHLQLISSEAMIQKFDVAKIGRSPVKFDQKQLDYLNRQAIKLRWKKAQQHPEQIQFFVEKVRSIIPQSAHYSEVSIKQMLDIVVQRLNFISDLGQFEYFFSQPDFDQPESKKDFNKLFGSQAEISINRPKDESAFFSVNNCHDQLLDRNRKIIHNLRIILEHVISPQNYSENEIAKHISQFLFQSPSLKNQEVFHLLRYIITGRKSGPSITKTCAFLGREVTLARLASFSVL